MSPKPSEKVFITDSLCPGYIRRREHIQRITWCGKGTDEQKASCRNQAFIRNKRSQLGMVKRNRDLPESLELQRRMLDFPLYVSWWRIIPVESSKSKESSRRKDEDIQLTDTWVIQRTPFFRFSKCMYCRILTIIMYGHTYQFRL